MKRKLTKTSKSLVVTVPSEFVKDMTLKEGDEFDFKQKKDKIEITIVRKE